MKEAVRQRARELGFDVCRFTTAAPPESGPAFASWIKAGKHGEMAYLARNAEKRVDPQKVLTDARSIVTLAVSYADGHNPGGKDQTGSETLSALAGEDACATPKCSPSKLTGVVARYALHEDYHDTLAEPLKQLSRFIDAELSPGARSLWYVDTGPLLERDLAQRSGLGFIGKHSNLISRSLGNWILLCEIITTAAFEPDAPETNHCGSCVRCLKACPTAAITRPFEVDARLCISYLTIELKGPIPLPLRPLIGNRIFGCDDCLAVCPWNRFAQAGRLLKARNDLGTPDLLPLLKLTDAEFKQRFADTPMLRSKRRGLLRNVCVALGNLGDPAALPHLENAAHDPEPLIAEHAKWAIDRIKGLV